MRAQHQRLPSHPIPSRRHPVAVPSWRNHPNFQQKHTGNLQGTNPTF